jgi:hypothetical protein
MVIQKVFSCKKEDTFFGLSHYTRMGCLSYEGLDDGDKAGGNQT